MQVVSRALVSELGVLVFRVTVVRPPEKAEEAQEERRVSEKSIEAVLEEHTDSLMALPGVVGTAQGECEGRPCVKVLVARRTPELLKQIPSSLDGYPVAIQETGEIRALDRR